MDESGNATTAQQGEQAQAPEQGGSGLRNHGDDAGGGEAAGVPSQAAGTGIGDVVGKGESAAAAVLTVPVSPVLVPLSVRLPPPVMLTYRAFWLCPNSMGPLRV